MTSFPFHPPPPLQGAPPIPNKFRLEVVQQPQRARMCGFGDKDRRPCTPPPIVQLIFLEEQDLSTMDVSFLVMLADIWSVDKESALNLVTSSTVSTVPASTQTLAVTLPPISVHQQQHQYHHYNLDFTQLPPPASIYSAHHQQPPSALQNFKLAPIYYNHPLQQQQQQQHYHHHHHHHHHHQILPPSSAMLNHYSATTPSTDIRNPPPPPPSDNGMISTRNLIGSLTTGAVKLYDLNGKLGIFFIFQDLSIRTEGIFRLKFSLMNLKQFFASKIPIDSPKSEGGGGGGGEEEEEGEQNLIGVRKPLAVENQVFSEPFTVFSAKKFPGMIESTPLSRCFARQGVKIPVRKDTTSAGSTVASLPGAQDEGEREV